PREGLSLEQPPRSARRHDAAVTAVTAASIASEWEPAAGPIAAGAVALLLFALAFARLRRRGRRDHATWQHAAVFVLGVSLLVLALVSPLDAVGDDYLLSGHMLQHAILLDAGPALVL